MVGNCGDGEEEQMGTRGGSVSSNEENYHIFLKNKIEEKEAEKETGKEYENR